MFKKNLLLLCLSVLVLSGCTKNYNTVDEYYAEMSLKSQKNAETGYKLEVSQSIPTKLQTEIYYRTYIKGDKWKTEVSMNGGISYMSTTIYDGQDVLTYAQGSPYAMVNPMLEGFSSESQVDKDTINSLNPVYSLIDWENGYISPFSFDTQKEHKIINNKDNRNGYNCRLISFSEDSEACVNDDNGLAVYMKSKYTDFNKKNLQEGTKEMTLNLVSYEKCDVSDSEFELPEGIQKMSFDKILDNIDKMLE